MFLVSEENTDSFVGDFVSKLLNNGYTLRSDEIGAYEYVKGDTVIHFSDVNVANISDGTEYTESYYYFNYYAYTL